MSVAVVDAGGTPRAVWRRGILASRKGRWGFVILTVLALIALFAPLLAPHDPNAIDATRILAPPDLAHPFGSDALGRDVLSRVFYAYRVSLAVAVGLSSRYCLVGVPLGLYAGYHGGWVDTAIMRPIDMVLALPAMLLAVALIAIIGLGGGFIPATTILFAATAASFGRRAIHIDVAIGLVLALAIYLLFDKLLTLSLPAGPLERLL